MSKVSRHVVPDVPLTPTPSTFGATFRPRLDGPEGSRRVSTPSPRLRLGGHPVRPKKGLLPRRSTVLSPLIRAY